MSQDQQETFFIHFDTRGINDQVVHQISLDTFIKTAQSLERVLEGFNEKLFDRKLDIKILILPPEDGGYFTKFIIWAALAGVGYMMTSDYGDSFIKEMTGKTRSEWGTNHALLLKTTTKKFLETDDEKIQNKTALQKQFPKAFAGRSDFYKVCINDTHLQGVEFSKNYQFIQRDRFPHYVSESVEEKLEPEYKVHKLKIISAVISKIDKQAKSPKWKGNDYNNNKNSEFYLTDDEFNMKFFNGEYPIQEANVIIAKFEYQKFKIDGEINPSKTTVSAVKIYSFNDEPIANIPDDLRIISIGENGITEKEEEPDLFNFLETNNTKNYDQK